MKLLPCPWGHKAESRSDGTVHCTMELCAGQWSEMTPDQWNTRPGETAQHRRVLKYAQTTIREKREGVTVQGVFDRGLILGYKGAEAIIDKLIEATK